MRLSRRIFIALFLLGLGVRLAFLSLPGTGDVTVFKIWAHAASSGRVAEMYGVGGSPPERRVHDYDGRSATVDYPPLALYELALAGRAYAAAFPGFPNTTALTAAVKFLPVAAEVGIFWLLVTAVARLAPDRPWLARYAGLAYWLNPAALLTSSVLGYMDALFALPALAAIIAASRGRAALAGVLTAAAVLTKPQAVLIVPAVGLALLGTLRPALRARALRAPALAGLAAVLACGAVLAPVAAAGGWANFLQAMASFSRHDMLSGQAANVWWVVTYVMRAAYAAPEMGLAGAFLSPVRRPLAITTIVQLGYPNPRLAATALVAVAAAWGLWKARHVRDLPRLALLVAWIVYAYFMLAVQVHENHFFLIVPFLAIPAAVMPEWRAPFWVLSATFALNLNLFYGFGDGAGFAVPRTITGIDATVWLSIANAAVLAWFAARLARSLDEPEPVATTIREDTPRRRESSSR